MRRPTTPTTPGSPDPNPPPERARRWLNLGVLAHVDAGKTSLTEALLLAGGAVERLGRVDDGTTQTDSLAMERRRGITIRTAVATFAVDDVTVNLVDTPGHPDFIAEVDRSLAVLDAAVLVVSAVEGVQAQTIVLHLALRRLGVPAVLWVNKVDRAGADPARVLDAVRRRLSPAVVPLGSVRGAGTPAVVVEPPDLDDPVTAELLTARLAEHDDTLLADWVRLGRPAPADRLREVLARLTRGGVVHPVLFGSARTGAGLGPLLDLLTTLAPAAGSPSGPFSGQVFKVERAPSGERVCSVRVRRGTLAVRDVVDLGLDRVGTVTALEVHEPGGPVVRSRAVAGQVVRVHGLAAAQVGDEVGAGARSAAPHTFPAPTRQTTVEARDPARRGALHRALAELADVDPLIRLRPDRRHGVLRIDVHGPVQQEVIADTLADEYGLEVDFAPTSVVCVERPARRASAVRRRGEDGHRPDYTCGLTVEPLPPGVGVELAVSAERLSLPLHVYANVEGFRAAVLGYLAAPLGLGPRGWAVTDLRVTVTESDYVAPAPTPADVRRTVAAVLGDALARAGTVVCAPVDAFRLETPDDTLTGVLNLLGRHRGVPDAPESAAGLTVLTGTVPTAEVDALRAGLATAAHGEAVLETALHHYAAG